VCVEERGKKEASEQVHINVPLAAHSRLMTHGIIFKHKKLQHYTKQLSVSRSGGVLLSQLLFF
jgi:hypothetical protein